MSKDDQGAVRDLIDVHAAARHHTTNGLEALRHRHVRTEFSYCLPPPDQITALRTRRREPYAKKAWTPANDRA
ncbi:hypothetical protein [Streptomyces sp. NPDC053427]|uniref:hypothetical protein n=1 Tax=Streptomyces sp. NPDC053427 TaxID=3365701 RepID=UPI0037D5FE18